jgi:hypothetical protein
MNTTRLYYKTLSYITSMKIEKDLEILRLSLATVLIVAFAGISVITPALSVSESNVETEIESRGCLIYQTYPSQAVQFQLSRVAC